MSKEETLGYIVICIATLLAVWISLIESNLNKFVFLLLIFISVALILIGLGLLDKKEYGKNNIKHFKKTENQREGKV